MAIANTIRFIADPVTGGGQTLYAVIYGADSLAGHGQIYNTATPGFENCSTLTWNSSPWPYKIALTQNCSGAYSASLPTPLQAPDRTYDFGVYKQNGGNPNLSADTLVGAGTIITGDCGLFLTLNGPPTCVAASDTIAFLATLHDNSGPVNADSLPTVAVNGGGSAVVTAVPSTTGIYKVVFSAPAGAGAESEVMITAVRTYGTTVLTRVAAASMKVCEAGTGVPLTGAQTADAVWNALRSGDSNAAAWAAGTMGASVNVNAAGFAAGTIGTGSFQSGAINANAIAASAITDTKFAPGAITANVIADAAIDAATFAPNAITASAMAAGSLHTTVFAANAINANALANDAVVEIAAGVEVDLSATHGPGSWEDAGGGGGGATFQLSSE